MSEAMIMSHGTSPISGDKTFAPYTGQPYTITSNHSQRWGGKPSANGPVVQQFDAVRMGLWLMGSINFTFGLASTPSYGTNHDNCYYGASSPYVDMSMCAGRWYYITQDSECTFFKTRVPLTWSRYAGRYIYDENDASLPARPTVDVEFRLRFDPNYSPVNYPDGFGIFEFVLSNPTYSDIMPYYACDQYYSQAGNRCSIYGVSQ